MEKYKENVITKEFYNFAWLRKELFDTKKIIYWIKLFKYKKYYVSFKSYVGDLYLCIKN